nr:hypothetical protein [Leuconostoc inhae]
MLSVAAVVVLAVLDVPAVVVLSAGIVAVVLVTNVSVVFSFVVPLVSVVVSADADASPTICEPNSPPTKVNPDTNHCLPDLYILNLVVASGRLNNLRSFINIPLN